jgi:excisionase family DNA binding protein
MLRDLDLRVAAPARLRMLSVGEVAEALGMSVSWVRDQVSSGAFPGAARWGSDVRVPERDVEAFAAAHRIFLPAA